MPARFVGSRSCRLRARCERDSQLLSDVVTVLAVLFLVLMSACSGGSEKSVANANFRCGDATANAVCLQSCNLGCSETGCGRTEIAQNERIILNFSENVDPNTVSSSSILFRTASGTEAVGEFLVAGNRVEFVPTLAVTGGQTYYGFTNGETYVMTIVGGDDVPSVVRGTSGRPFGETLTCTLVSQLGIIDYDGLAPTAVMVSPAVVQNAPLDSIIELEFSELIDPTPFLNTVQSPVRFFVRAGVENSAGEIECDPNADRQPLAGSAFPTFDAARGTTTLSFVPSAPLPGNACVEVEMGAEVVDMSGRAALPETFSFTTLVQALEPGEVSEDFTTQEFFDRDTSAATWDGGQLAFAAIGGDGRHGKFDVSIAGEPTFVGGVAVYELDCDSTIIPKENTITGAAMPVTDGRFYFTEFVVPSGVRLRFVGSSPPVITASGRIEVQGEVDLRGASLASLPSPGLGSSLTPGQAGAVGAVFGGAGGKGGDQGDGLGTGGGAFDGEAGSDVTMVSGHAYVQSRLGTGGNGSTVYPTSGLTTERLFNTALGVNGGTPCLNVVAGGGGGGSAFAGEPGQVISVNVPNPATGGLPWLQTFGPEAPAAMAAQVLPYPAIGSSMPSSRHFLVGGAGGGGAASNTTFTVEALTLPRWAPGGGGAGGGGAIGLRAGGSLRIGSLGSVVASGGSTPDMLEIVMAARAVPGGGGGGGSVLLQSAGSVDMFGQVDVSGGIGGTFDRSVGILPNGAHIVSKAGDGSPGLVRLEAPSANAAALAAAVSPSNALLTTSSLQEQDGLVACQSLYYSTGLSLGPQYDRYEITALVDGVLMVFSDDPAVSTMSAISGAPLRASFQAATMDLATGEISDVKPWRSFVRSTPMQPGIASDQLNAFRFRLVVDRTFAQEVIVQRVVVIYRN